MGEVVLAIVASGFAVASLSLQLVEIAQSLHTFWDSCGQTNAKVDRIKGHLALLQAISASIIQTCKEEPNIEYGNAVIESLAICKKETEKLCGLVSTNSKSRNGGLKKWSRVKITLKDKTIDKIESQLSGDIMMLILALQPFYHGLSKHAYLHPSPLLTLSPDHEIGGKGHERGTGLSEFEMLYGINSISKSRTDTGSRIIQQYNEGYRIFKLDSNTILLRMFGLFQCSVPSWLRRDSWNHIIRFIYTSPSGDLGVFNNPIRKVFKTRVEVLMPLLSFQVQILRSPWSITSYYMVHCQSEIFTLCFEGNLKRVRLLVEKLRMSPLVVNQHGENLLHAAAQNAHDSLCLYLLSLGVDGAAYDSRLLTPLDHLARKIPPSFGQPRRVVNTIRALVEKGQCQPLLPITSNAITYYRGPEEGFVWLFNAEYEHADLAALDSEQWTLLGDAAFNFGWWSQLAPEEVSLGWQSLYLLRRGADPHSQNSRQNITPLDTFLRGNSAHGVSHARKWLKIVAQSGLNVLEYAKKEQSLHGSEHCLIGTWDHDLYRWLPTKNRVMYSFGERPDDLFIWVEPYDALGWFGCGKWDLELLATPGCGSVATMSRWRALNDPVEASSATSEIVEHGSVEKHKGISKKAGYKVTDKRVVGLFILSLVFHYLLYCYMAGRA